MSLKAYVGYYNDEFNQHHLTLVSDDYSKILNEVEMCPVALNHVNIY